MNITALLLIVSALSLSGCLAQVSISSKLAPSASDSGQSPPKPSAQGPLAPPTVLNPKIEVPVTAQKTYRGESD